MDLDDSKHKVYIYNLDDELSSSDGESNPSSPTDGGGGRVVFLADMEKHLRDHRHSRLLPPGRALDPRPDSPPWSGKELVLYRVPSSISVPEEQDSVRKAIMEARERVRARQRAGADVAIVPVSTAPPVLGDLPMDAEPVSWPGLEDDPDAMELDE